MGNKKLPGIPAEDIGKSIGIAGEHLTGGRMAGILSIALGRYVHYNQPK